MINKEFTKRFITSFLLLVLLALMNFYNYILIIALIIITLISWIEFNGLVLKIFNKNNFLKITLKLLGLLYISSLSILIMFTKINNPDYIKLIMFPILISITSDLGGFFFGKILGGPKLSKISPNKTIAGSIGSFVFSLMLIPIFFQVITDYSLVKVALFIFIISFVSQTGDLFISYLKRKANVEDTGDLLPGHGGFLDRIDGIIFAVPVGFLLFST